MQILIHADRNVAQTGKSNETIERAVRSTANRFDTQITPIDLYLNDVNCAKGGANDKRCVFEVRPAGLDPLAVNHHASTIELVVAGGNGKLPSLLDSALGRLGSDRKQRSPPGESIVIATNAGTIR